MTVFEPSAGQAALPAITERSTTDQRTEGQRHYIGVVLIHGIGNIKRNALLQQALNALSYWYNHEAGCALRSEGAGRQCTRAGWRLPRHLRAGRRAQQAGALTVTIYNTATLPVRTSG
jgi:hypothetical protein